LRTQKDIEGDVLPIDSKYFSDDYVGGYIAFFKENESRSDYDWADDEWTFDRILASFQELI
jgi:hypothetical protein